MPKKRYKPIPLTGASKILRAHSTQIKPPGLLEMKNLYLSRSDNSIGIRSDWVPDEDGMYSYGPLIQGSDAEDYMNASFYVSRAGHTIWFGRWAPFTWDGISQGQLFTIYDTGTITTDGTRKEVIGEGTSWLQQIWPGCLIREKTEGAGLYVVEHVSSDTRLVTTEAMDGLAGSEYEVYRVHPATRAEWPIRLASLGGYLVYGTVDINQPIDSKFISGPFYSNIGRPNLGVWFGVDAVSEDLAVPISAISVGWDQSYYGGVQRGNISNYNPITIAGDFGAAFSRNWFGEDISITASISRASERVTYAPNAGTRSNVVFASASTAGAELLTSVGEIIALDSSQQSMEGGVVQTYFAPESGAIVEQPFGEVELTAKVGGSYFVGANGLLGIASGTTYTTGVSATLRGGCAFAPGWTGSGYHVIVGDDDGDAKGGIILHFTAPGSITRADSGESESWNGAAYSVYLDRVIVVGTNGACVTSDDQGATWTSRTVGAATDLRAVACDAQGRAICAVGNSDYGDPQCWVSMDGVTWTQVTGFTGTDDLVDVKFRDTDGCFYIADGSGRVYRLRRRVQILNGSTTLGTIGNSSDFVTDIYYDGGGFVAVGSKIWTSPAGAVWTERADLVAAGHKMLSVAKDEVGGSNWVAVGVGGIIYRSTDNAVTWAQVTSPVTVDLMGVVFHYVSGFSGDFIFVGKEGKVYRSADGSAWVPMSFPSSTDLLSIASDHTNTGTNQKNIYAMGVDAVIYTNKMNNGAYDGWAPWEATSKHYVDNEELTDYSGRYMQKTSIRGRSLIGIMDLGPVRAVTTDGVRLISIEHLDEGRSTPIVADTRFYSQIYYNTDTSSWHPVSQATGLNAAAIANNGDFSPVLLVRHFAPYVMVNGKYPAQTTDSFIVSTDFGLTWSNAYNSSIDTWTLPQECSRFLSKSVFLAGWYWFPVCTDGTDFILVQSSNIYGVVPRVEVLAGYELVTDLSEV